MRKRLFKLHSYFSLIALIPLIIVSVTGSILVFKTEIDQWLMPGVAAMTYSTEERDSLTRKNHDILNRTVETTFDNYVIGGWEMFDDGLEADRIYIVEKNTDNWYKVYFDPFANKVLSEPIKLESLLTDWLLVLHYSFMLNGVTSEHSQIGTFIGLIVSVILIFLAISGLILHKKFWRQLLTLRIKKAIRIVAGDIHRLIGAWSAPLILVLGITGFYFNLMGIYHELFEHPAEEHYMPPNKLYNENISISALIEESKSQLDNFEPTFIRYPSEPNIDFIVYGFQPTLNVFASNYSSTATFSKMSGDLIQVTDGREASIPVRILDSFRELHFGSFAGSVSKIIYCLLGLSPFLLGVTGVFIWSLRRSKKPKRKDIRLSKPEKVGDLSCNAQ